MPVWLYALWVLHGFSVKFMGEEYDWLAVRHLIQRHELHAGCSHVLSCIGGRRSRRDNRPRKASIILASTLGRSPRMSSRSVSLHSGLLSPGPRQGNSYIAL